MEERDREWFAGCKLDHTASFPYLSYDIIRTVGALMIFQLFLPVAVTAIFAFLASLVILRQILIERRIAAKTHSNIQNYRAMRQLVVLRATLWGSGSALALSVAPQALLVGIIPAALLVMMIDVLCMIAMPKQAVLAGMIHMLAIAVPLALWAQGPALFGAVAAVIGLVFMHWAVFNLHYVFATRRLRTRELENANDTIQLLLNQYDQDGSDWLIECDEDGAILRPNARFCKAADRAAEELDGLRLSMLFKNSPERDELRAIGIREEPFRDLVVPLAVEGKDLWWSISARPVYDRDGKLASWRGFIADVTRTHKAEAKVSYMAHYDVLTNLPNRSLFGTSMRRAFARRGDDDLMAVLYVDLDHFKSINDTFGHAEGDAVLAEAARRIEQAVGNKAMVARLGGDEFAVLLDRIDNREAALKAAQAIVSAKDEPVQMTGHELQIGASVGVAFAPDNASNGEELLRVADLALYDAKSRGRRGANLFDPGMQKVVQERRSLELDLRAALANGELEVFYQPLLSAQDTQIVGYEALLRWHHPTLGSVSPDVFIPIAEENGQIIPIGAWVLREALHEAANWPDEIFISVNLSPGQMQDKSLLNTVVGALASSGVSPDRLELEITETLLMQDNDENIAILHKFRELGIQIALDDFGTGYSSLNYLRSFPFDKIKIDRCFVTDIAERKDNDAIIQAVVDLAGKLQMVTTAEGVENQEQLAKLRSSGCTQVQGFLFSKALPASELAHGSEKRNTNRRHASVTKLAANQQAHEITPEEKPQRKAG